MNLLRVTQGLQFRLTLGFAVILALTLAGVGSYSAYATRQETRNFAEEVEFARSLRAEQLVNDAYGLDEDWARVQYAVHQVGMLFGWRVVVANQYGYIVADSHNVVTQPDKHLDEGAVFAGKYIKRPLWVQGRQIGYMLVDRASTTGPPPPDQVWVKITERRTGRAPGKGAPVDSAEPDPQGARPYAPLAAAAPTSEVISQIAEPSLSRLESSFQRSLMIAGLGAGIAGLLIVTLFTREALSPIRSLTGAARRLGGGDLSYRVPSNRRDEMGELATTFNEMATTLERTEAHRRNMTADIAHELRTPLTNIRGYIEAIQDGVLEPDASTIETLHQQTIHLSRLVEDLRILSIADAGSLRLDLEKEDVATIARDTVNSFKPRAAELGLAIEFKHSSDLPEANVDRTRIGQVVANLVENALTYTPKGGTVTVSVGQSAAGALELAVEDTGPGIPSDVLPRVFDQFYRVDKSRSRSTGGAGIGLTIVRKLVEAHGGTVRAETKPGKGARFVVTLPTA